MEGGVEGHEIGQQQDSDNPTLTILSERLTDNRERLKETKDAVAGLRERMDTRSSRRPPTAQ